MYRPHYAFSVLPAVLPAVLFAALAPVAARGAPFDLRTVDADAQFVAFVDLDAARTSPVGTALLARLIENPDYVAFEQIMVAVAGFMPAHDVADVTVYGLRLEPEPQATLVIHATLDAGQLRGGLSLAPGFRAEKYDDARHAARELLSWDDERTKKRVFAGFFDERTIVLGADAERLKRAVDVLADPTRSAEGKQRFAVPAAGSWAFLGALGISKLPAAANNPVLGEIDRAALEFGDPEGKALVRLTATTGSPAKGETLFNLANGLRALGIMAGRQRVTSNVAPDAAEGAAQLAGELAAATRVTRDAAHDPASVTATTTLTSERVVALIAELEAIRDARAK